MTKLLIIDDSAFQLQVLSSNLKTRGFDVQTAVNGKDGLEKKDSFQPDVIMTDLLMPEMSGFDFVEKVRESDGNIPIVVMTADIQESSVSRCIELGATRVLHKPPNVQELITTLKELSTS